MELTVGAIVEGKVKSITNFGAFIALPENKTGMVHISEVANAYVSDIRQHLTEGQDVKVMVIGNENGKINLSIKRLEPRPQRDAAPRGGNNNFRSQNPQQRTPWHRQTSGTARRAQNRGSAVRGEAEGLHDRVRQQNLLHQAVFRPQNQEQKKVIS